MSYYVDPWLFNCTDNPADSPADQAEQRTIITAVQRALDYAHRKGVTLVAGGGQRGHRLHQDERRRDAAPTSRASPGEAPYARDIPPSCISMPSEGNHVIPVSATGPSTRKSYYSSFGQGYVDVAAPGGDAYDTPDGSRDITGVVLAAYPYNVGVAVGDIDPDTGDPTNEFVVKDCEGGTCAYYQYLQGTSMASPHAVGVAALIVSHYGCARPVGCRVPARHHGVRSCGRRRTRTTARTRTRSPTCASVPQADGSIATRRVRPADV